MNALQAARQSLALSASTFTPSPLDPVAVALAVGRERAAQDVHSASRVGAESAPVRPSHLLGCWVDGELRFQSRQHDNVHAYAQGAMQGAKHRTVWVAPVGSFVDTDSAAADDARKMRRVKKGSRRG